MKRLLSMVCALFVLLSVCVLALPVNAEGENEWQKLTYTLDPKNEGEESVTGTLVKETELLGNCTIRWDAAVTKVMLNGLEIAEDYYRFETAGEYKLKAVDRARPTSVIDYKLTVLPDIKVQPDINLVNGQVFTSYPTFECTNTLGMEHEQYTGRSEPYVSGAPIRSLGSHLLTVYGKGEGNSVVKFEYRFYVKACHVERVFDESRKKEAMNIIVGTFDDMTVEATLDGTRALTEGSNIETKVGQHTLDIDIVRPDGVREKLTSNQAKPGAEALMLRVELYIDAQESKDPFSFDLSRWDADILLDGKLTKESVRIGKHGEHKIAVRGADGQLMENGLSVTIGEEGTPTPMTELKFTFRNPHILYAIIVAVPAVILLAAAGYFLVARRRVV